MRVGPLDLYLDRKLAQFVPEVSPGEGVGAVRNGAVGMQIGFEIPFDQRQ